MISRLDHVMLAVPDVEDAMAVFKDRLGLPVVYGGVHRHGTHNGLVCFDGELAYLELFGPQRPELANQQLRDWLDVGGGIWRYAVGSNDLEADRARLLASGFDPAPIGEHSRQRPDGVVLEWRMFRVSEATARAWPFIIDWGPDAPRLVDLRQSGHFAPSPLGATRLLSLTVLTPALEAYLEVLERGYGVTAGDVVADARGRGCSVLIGESQLEVLEPLADSEVGQELAARGEGPWRLTIGVASVDTARDWLEARGVRHAATEAWNGVTCLEPDPADACGVRLRFVEG